VDEHPEQHEQSDISIKSMVIFFVVFLAFAVLAHLGLFALYAAFDRSEQGKMNDVSGVTATSPPPATPLQGLPSAHANTAAEDTRLFFEEQHRLLSSGGPTTQPGYVRIPVRQAMDLLIDRRMLPVRHSGSATPATRPSESAGAMR
jgi:hypothetical protein